MPDPFNFRILCLAIVEIALFPFVAMYYERKMRRLVPLSVVVIVLGIVGVCLSLLEWFIWLPPMAKASASLSLSSLSLTYLAVFALVWVGVFQFFQHGGLALMKKGLLDALKSLAVTSLGFVVLFLIVFLWNFHNVYEVVVVHPPRVQITWTRLAAGLEVMPGIGPQSLTPQSLGNRSQYIIEVTPVEGTTISSNTVILFQFPYVVEEPKLNAWNTQASFGPAVSPLPVILGGNVRIIGQQEYRHWRLVISDMLPNGKVRLVVLLNPDYQDMMMVFNAGKVPKHEPPPLPMPPPPLHGPLYEYICAYTQFVYGGQIGHTEIYAPFQVNTKKVVSIGNVGNPPKNLSVTFEVP
ncbi:MAG TPA: hypothetical protein VNZ03_19200 [Terriglobales bacterium]|jgi:hypothetical protein|nr:hypothetical protein [Terriglobales bacterium]